MAASSHKHWLGICGLATAFQPIRAVRKTDETTGLSLDVWRDADPLNPRRGWDHLGTMVCWHRRHDLGDSQP